MKTLSLPEKRKSQRVPVELSVLGELEDRRLEMCTDNISLEGMFLFCREFVRPHATFVTRVSLTEEEAPLQLYVTACFTERTWTGYGIGVHISGISAADRILWESFYRTCAIEHAAQLRQLVQSERTVGNRRILAVDGALSPLAVQALRKQGLEVTQVASIGEAIAVLDREPIEAVISDLQRPGLDGRLLCKYVNERRLPTRTVLLTSSAVANEFLLGLHAAATRVIAKPCSNELLVSRILDVLQQRLPSGRSWPEPGEKSCLPSLGMNPCKDNVHAA